MSRQTYSPLYGWLLIVGIMGFGFYLLWDYKLLQRLLTDDVTYLSTFILLLFCAVTFYLGIAAWRLARQNHFVVHAKTPKINNAESLALEDDIWVVEHLNLVDRQRRNKSNDSETLLARLIERVHRGHTSGWFLSDILMRLGLIGTVIGFVLMLSTVYKLKNTDIDTLQQLLATMGSGMQVALFTTLTGLGTALLVSIQCQWLDYCADKLVSQIIKLSMQSPEDRPI